MKSGHGIHYNIKIIIFFQTNSLFQLRQDDSSQMERVMPDLKSEMGMDCLKKKWMLAKF